MRVTLNKFSALRLMRALRQGGWPLVQGPFGHPVRRTGMIAPDPHPAQRWTRRVLDVPLCGLDSIIGQQHPLCVAVGKAGWRIRMRSTVNTVYEREDALPADAFIEVDEGIAISGPELLFAEAASFMDLPRLVLLGHELCGSFSRNPDDPRNGDAAFKLAPVTTVARIKGFLKRIRRFERIALARRAIEFVSENAWSPMEAVISTLVNLPEDELGYEMGICVLNKRIDVLAAKQRRLAIATRVPDILLPGTHVGFNYDGQEHLDLRSVADAAVRQDRRSTGPVPGLDLARAMNDVRGKYIDDLRRNRELAASGYVVLPVTKEDLYSVGGLDYAIGLAVEAIEAFDGADMGMARRLLGKEDLSARRQQLIWSLVPGTR